MIDKNAYNLATDSPIENKTDWHDQQEISYPRMTLFKKNLFVMSGRFSHEWSVFSCVVTVIIMNCNLLG